VKWAATNVALFVATQLAYVAFLAALARAPVDVGITIFMVGLLFTSPFLAIYLALIAALPVRWTQRRRRTVAIAASPLLLIIFIALAFTGPTGASLLGIAAPGALAYGAVIRLRDGGGVRRAQLRPARL
jgi:hypothetical protein